MRNLVSKCENYLDTLSVRDQASLGIIFLIVLLTLWFWVMYVPLSDEMTTTRAGIVKNQSNLATVRAKIVAQQRVMAADPDRANRELLEKYVEDNKRLDEALAKTTTQIINPQEMNQLLERILEQQPGLKFLSLSNRQAAPEFVEANAENTATVENVNSIYRHSVVLKFEGSYQNALEYMKKLEALPWRFFWQSVEIEAREYPNAVITLEVYTLGFREGLIGV